VSDRYTIRRDDDGAAHIHQEGKRWSQTGYRPADPFDELVLQAVVDGLNGRDFKLTGTALDIAHKCGIAAWKLELHIRTKAYSLQMQMMQG
jgi:hypothetical protein